MGVGRWKALYSAALGLPCAAPGTISVQAVVRRDGEMTWYWCLPAVRDKEQTFFGDWICVCQIHDVPKEAFLCLTILQKVPRRRKPALRCRRSSRNSVEGPALRKVHLQLRKGQGGKWGIPLLHPAQHADAVGIRQEKDPFPKCPVIHADDGVGVDILLQRSVRSCVLVEVIHKRIIPQALRGKAVPQQGMLFAQDDVAGALRKGKHRELMR